MVTFFELYEAFFWCLLGMVKKVLILAVGPVDTLCKSGTTQDTLNCMILTNEIEEPDFELPKSAVMFTPAFSCFVA